jgi:hypothetical protein
MITKIFELEVVVNEVAEEFEILLAMVLRYYAEIGA